MPPSAMVKALKLTPDIRQYVWAPLLVLIVGLAATAAVSWQMWRMAEAKDADRFTTHVGQTRQNLNTQMEAYSALLRDTAALFSSAHGAGRREFRTHVEHLELRMPVSSGLPGAPSLPRYPALLGVGWVEREPAASPGETQITGPRFGLADSADRYAIAFLEPAEWRKQVAGDPGIFTRRESLEAMAQARDSGNVTASTRIDMIQEFWAGTRSGIHLFRPVYQGGRLPATVAERRRKLQGLIDAALQTDELFARAHGGIARREVTLEVYDGSRAERASLIYRSEGAQPSPEAMRAPRLVTTMAADIAARSWTLVFRTKPEFEAASDRKLVAPVILIGVLISLLLAGANLFQSRARSALNASEKRYRRLFETSPDGVFLFDAESGLLTDANPYLVELLGVSREKLIGRTLWESGLFTNPDLGRKAFRVLQDNDSYRYEQLPITGPDGKPWYVDFTCNAYKASGKRVMQCNVRNITDRKRAEDALRDSEERYRTLVEVSPQGVWIADRDGALTYVNQYWIEYSGMSLAQSLGTGWHSQIHPEDRQRMLEAWRTALDTGSMLETELRLRRTADSIHRWHIVRSVPVRDTAGRIDRWLGVFVDIHERKQTEQERADMLVREQMLRTEAEAANRAKDDFLATLSHELRTPLNAILGWTQTLQLGDTTKSALLRALGQIETSANAQAKLINDLLNVADIGAGRLRLEIQPVSLIPLVESVIESLGPAMAARDIVFKSELDPVAGTISGDPGRLQQIVWNLLSNAVKFTARGGHITITLRQRTPDVELSVIDDGDGISAEFLPFVFDRFRQADESIKRRHGGLGLGLAIVRHLAELHGGSVSAHSDGKGHGARFSVRLPIRAIQPAGSRLDAVDAPAAATPAAAFVARRPQPLTGLRIVSVDDDSGTREMLHEALVRAGARVASAASAREALVLLQSVRPDVLVSDIGLPDEDGYDLIRQVRSLPADAGGKTPSIALTGYARLQDQQAVLAAGYQAFLAKPVNLSELVAVLIELGGKRKGAYSAMPGTTQAAVRGSRAE